MEDKIINYLETNGWKLEFEDLGLWRYSKGDYSIKNNFDLGAVLQHLDNNFDMYSIYIMLNETNSNYEFSVNYPLFEGVILSVEDLKVILKCVGMNETV